MTSTAVPASTRVLAGRELPAEILRCFGDLRGKLDGELLALALEGDDAILTVEDGGVLRRWDLATGNQRESTTLSDLEAGWVFSPDAKLLAAGSQNVTLWDVASGTLLVRLPGDEWVRAMAFSPDGKVLASGHDDHGVRLWDTSSGRLLHELKSHAGEVCALAFRRDGARLASAGEDRTVFVWDVATGQAVRELVGHTDRVDAITWSLSGDRLASAGWDTSVRVWNPETGDLLAMLNGQGECVHCVDFTPDGKWLVSGDSDGVARLWDYERLKVLKSYDAHRGPVKHLALAHGGNTLVTGGVDRAVINWDVSRGEARWGATGACTAVHAVELVTPDTVAAVYEEGALALWDLATGSALPAPGIRSRVAAMASGPNGVWVTGTADGFLAVWEGRNTTPRLSWQAHEGEIRELALDPRGDVLASTSGLDGMVRLWKLADGEPLLFIPQAVGECAIEAMAFHPRRPWIAVGGVNWVGAMEAEGDTVLWNWETREVARRFAGGASRIAFSPDGSVMAVVSLFETILLWEVATGKLLHELSARSSTVNAIAFDSQNRYLAAGSDDAGVRLWNVHEGKLVTTFDLETRIKALAFTAAGDGLLTGNGNSTCYLVGLAGLSTGP